MEAAKKFFIELKDRIDFKFHLITLAPLLIALLTPLACAYLPIKYAYENSLIENFQLFVLLVTFIICIRPKTDKKFFYSMALVIIILFLREINCGRTIFFPIEGVENAFYSWKEIPYGYLAHPIYGAFMALSGLYFILTKSFMVLWNYFLHAKLPIYNWIFLVIGIFFGLLGEEIDAPMLEEMTETLFYVSLMALLYLQSNNKKYIETTEKYYKQNS